MVGSVGRTALVKVTRVAYDSAAAAAAGRPTTSPLHEIDRNGVTGCSVVRPSRVYIFAFRVFPRGPRGLADRARWVRLGFHSTSVRGDPSDNASCPGQVGTGPRARSCHVRTFRRSSSVGRVGYLARGLSRRLRGRASRRATYIRRRGFDEPANRTRIRFDPITTNSRNPRFEPSTGGSFKLYSSIDGQVRQLEKSSSYHHNVFLCDITSRRITTVLFVLRTRRLNSSFCG